MDKFAWKLIIRLNIFKLEHFKVGIKAVRHSNYLFYSNPTPLFDEKKFIMCVIRPLSFV